MKDMVERLLSRAKSMRSGISKERLTLYHRQDAEIDEAAAAELTRLCDENDRLRRGLMGAAVFAKPDAELTRLRALNAELVEALEACPLPSTMGNVKTHYDQFYDWYNKHVEPTLTRAKGES